MPLSPLELAIKTVAAVSLLIALYLLLVIVLPLTLSVAVSYRTLPEGRSCPLCAGETLRLRARWIARASWVVRRAQLHRRWCLTCGWEGICRLPASAVEPSDTVKPRSGGGVIDPQRSKRRSIAVGPGQTGEAVNLRSIEIDGSPWRVLLQCWSDARRWYGRLLFIAPSGRLWVDTVEPFTGPSPNDVLGQALALTDQTLAYRLRELISE